METLTKRIFVRRGFDTDGVPVMSSVSSDEIDNCVSLADAFDAVGGDVDRPYVDSVIDVAGAWPVDPTAGDAPAADASITLPPPAEMPIAATVAA